jgi:hypothetical protein
MIIAGQTQFGTTSGPVVVRTLTDYVRLFGVRTGGAPMLDAAEFFLGQGGGELVVQRAYGPSAVLATVTLDTNKITVTAKSPGAYYNDWTAAYTAASKTLTITKGTRSATYTGTDAATLQADASSDADVTVTVATLPSGNVSATALASGADDYANVAWATVLGRVTNAVGSGAMVVPGVAGAASALAAAATPRRVALLTGAVTDGDAAVIVLQGAISASAKQHATYVNQWGYVQDRSTGVLKAVDGAVAAATYRALAMRTYGLGASALMRDVHRLVQGFTPAREIDDATHTSLLAAGVVTIRTLPTGVGIDVWATPEGVGGNAALTGLQFRDMVNAIADLGSVALDGFVGLPASQTVLGNIRAALEAVCEQFRPWLVDNGPLDPGYRVTVNAGDVSDNRVAAVVSVKFVESLDWLDFTVVSASADQTI